MKDRFKLNREKRQRRANRTRANIFGVPEKPRLSVFRSNSHIYAQLIDDQNGRTLASVSDLEIKKTGKKTKIEIAFLAGKEIAKKAEPLKLIGTVFDKGGYKYHGIVKSLAEGAREGGLKF